MKKKNINTFFKRVGVAVLCGLWALELPWQHGSCCIYVSRICMLNLNLLDFIVPDISTFIRTDRRTWYSWLALSFCMKAMISKTIKASIHVSLCESLLKSQVNLTMLFNICKSTLIDGHWLYRRRKIM